ncbi:MAG: integration host factor subunit beta [Planctomycetota bacterium]|nr:MAG: integration host factor subunit beta [Planctomycetota bacterium]
MTKKEIVRTISEELGMTQLRTKEIVQKTFDAIIEALVTNGKIELRNFGVFKVKLRQPRKARNPKTSKPMDVPAKFVVTFKPGKKMEERIRQLEQQQLAESGKLAEFSEAESSTPAAQSEPLQQSAGQQVSVGEDNGREASSGSAVAPSAEASLG